MQNEKIMQNMADALYFEYQAVDSASLKTISAQLGDIGGVEEGDSAALANAAKVGGGIAAISALVEKADKKAERMIYDTLFVAGENEYYEQRANYKAAGEPIIPFVKNKPLQTVLDATAARYYAEVVNLSSTLGFVNTAGQWQPIANFYRDTINEAAAMVRAGVVDYNAAIRSAIMHMSDSGLSYVAYESGYVRRLDSSVRSNLLDAQKAMSLEYGHIMGGQFGADGYEISFHFGFRPTHDFGGKQFTIDKYKSDVLPLLKEANCRHVSFPILLGVSTPAYSKQELRTMNAREKEYHAFEGRQYDSYQAAQKQREIELAIRKQKDRALSFSAANNAVAVADAKAAVSVLNGKYSAFSGAMGLTMYPNKTAVIGYK